MTKSEKRSLRYNTDPVYREKIRAYNRQSYYKYKQKYLEKYKDNYKDDPNKYKQRSADFRKNNPEKYKSDQLKIKYGIDINVYNEMLRKQKFCCKICETNVKDLSRALAVDHCHVTGVVRGLLCGPCNVALGSFKDNIKLLKKAITYLEKSVK